MKSLGTLLATAALLAVPAAASASARSGAVEYIGRTNSGHQVTFQVAHGAHV